MKILAKSLRTLNSKLFYLLLFLATPVSANQVFVSSEQSVPLLELYSTQSCSSCPPAQKWVSSLKSNKNLWKTFVPIVFHVDYWDYLGWKDPYSEKKYTVRQRNYVREISSSPYTPMFIIGGKEARRSRSSYLKLGPKVGKLKVTHQGDGRFLVQFNSLQTTKNPLFINYSLLGNGISTKVTAGENDGENLRHNFLSLKMGKQPLKKKKDFTKLILRLI